MADNKNTPKPKPSAKPTAPVAITPEVEAEELISEVEAEEVEAEVVEIVAKPAYTESVKTSKVPGTTYSVVSNDAIDTVHVSKVVVHNKAQKKSLSVHHVQRRLAEWGFRGAYLDKDGYCGDHTVSALAEFQKSLGLEATGTPDHATLSRLFEGDTNVRLAD